MDFTDLPVVGGDTNLWGDKLLTALQELRDSLNTNAAQAVIKDSLVFNVQDHGAAPGGSAVTNLAAFQATLAAVTVFAGGLGGATIYVPPGSFQLSAGLTVLSGHKIVGAGQVATQIWGDFNGPVLTTPSNGGGDPLTNYIHIGDMQIRNANTGSAARAIYFHQLSNLTVERCSIRSSATGAGSSYAQFRAVIVAKFDQVRFGGTNGPDHACKLEASNNRVLFHGCSFTDAKGGLVSLGGISLGVNHCHFEALMGGASAHNGAIYVDGTISGTVEENYFESCACSAIVFGNAVADTTAWDIGTQFITNCASPVLNIAALKFGRIAQSHIIPGAIAPNANGLVVGAACTDLMVHDQKLTGGSGTATSIDTAANRIVRIAGGMIRAYFAASTDVADRSSVVAEAQVRYERTAEGRQRWGGGASATDLEMWRSAANVLSLDGDFRISVAGKGLRIAEGANARMGVSTLVAGTVTVANTSVTANTRIFLTRSTVGGTLGHLSHTKSNGVSFTINSSSATDTSVIQWLLIESA